MTLVVEPRLGTKNPAARRLHDLEHEALRNFVILGVEFIRKQKNAKKQAEVSHQRILLNVR